MSRAGLRRNLPAGAVVVLLVAAAGIWHSGGRAAGLPASPAKPKSHCRLRITTPYSARHPLHEALALDDQASSYVGSVRVDSLTISDTSPTTKRWTLKAHASTLKAAPAVGRTTSPGQRRRVAINSQNVGLVHLSVVAHSKHFNRSLHNLTVRPRPPATPPVAPTAKGSRGLGGKKPHEIAHAVHGRGWVRLVGTLRIVAPTSTPTGQFRGSLTFAVGCGRVVIPIAPQHHKKHHQKHHKKRKTHKKRHPPSAVIAATSPPAVSPVSSKPSPTAPPRSHHDLRLTALKVAGVPAPAAASVGAGIIVLTGALLQFGVRRRRSSSVGPDHAA